MGGPTFNALTSHPTCTSCHAANIRLSLWRPSCVLAPASTQAYRQRWCCTLPNDSFYMWVRGKGCFARLPEDAHGLPDSDGFTRSTHPACQ
eukprot:1159519-Pelagomonas_calceolata.AAC.13